MKIEHKIYFSNLVHIGLIILIGSFALQNLNELLTKFRFTGIADDLNTTFLEMRLAEKNYVINGDDNALQDIRAKIAAATQSLVSVQGDIVRAVGLESFNQLQQYMVAYAQVVDKIHQSRLRDPASLTQLRGAGQKLKLFSEEITQAERRQVTTLVNRSKDILHYSFWAVVFFAVFFSQLIVRNITTSLRRIVTLTRMISKGKFQPLAQPQTSRDEMGEVIEAIDLMSEELKKREQELIQSRRLASIGILVAGVAHELSNPLNNISMIAQTYAEVYEQLSAEERLEFMVRVEEQSERLRVIIKNLLDFSRPKELHLAETEVNVIIQKTIELIQNMVEVSNIELTLQLDSQLPPVYVDEHQILQVLVNIATNAIQALDAGSGGKLLISSRFRPENREVEIEIGDNGRGIAAEFLDHIFDPFFTTKGENGTGLGLWVSYGIIKNHGGTIRAESSVGVGTAFFITLPGGKKNTRWADEQL